jgi:hypothetical protein
MESLLPLVDTVELLEQKHIVEQQIEYLRQYMESEKKRDFVND